MITSYLHCTCCSGTGDLIYVHQNAIIFNLHPELNRLIDHHYLFNIFRYILPLYRIFQYHSCSIITLTNFLNLLNLTVLVVLAQFMPFNSVRFRKLKIMCLGKKRDLLKSAVGMFIYYNITWRSPLQNCEKYKWVTTRLNNYI